MVRTAGLEPAQELGAFGILLFVEYRRRRLTLRLERGGSYPAGSYSAHLTSVGSLSDAFRLTK
jgi:hypothetical protein